MTDKILQYLPALCNQIKRLAVEAGEATLEFYDESGSGSFEEKEDLSPVTEADHAANKIILEGLKSITPSVAVVSEEDVEKIDVTGLEYFWLVDPLDGTRGFIKGNPDYTVNIALIQNGVPILGVIYAPVLGELYAGCGPETATRWLEETGIEKLMMVRTPKREGLTIVLSNYMGVSNKRDAMIEQFKVAKIVKRASSIKFCMLAAAKADFYLCMREISEWDTAAGDAILRSAGGMVLDLEGKTLVYGKKDKNFMQPFFQATTAAENVVSLEDLNPV